MECAVLGEIVEHLDNPVEFLSRMRQELKGLAQKVIITVPNAYSLVSLRLYLKNVEGINSDHRYAFTPYTICKVCSRAGLTPTEVLFASFPYSRRFGVSMHGALNKIVSKPYWGLAGKMSCLSQTIIVECDIA